MTKDKDKDKDEDLHAEAEVAAALQRRIGEGQPQPRLEPTRRALRRLHDPQRAYESIHITGTNGKTSTSRIAESVLRAGGKRTGLFTSPDLGHITQRISVDGRPVGGRDLLRYWRATKIAVDAVDRELVDVGLRGLTFFEALTVLAFAVFAGEGVDIAVIEVGVGGEWDATNVIDGGVAVFTPIDLDHTQVLGRSVAEIASTKSGIIKRGAAVISAEQVPDAHAVLFATAKARDARLYVEPNDFGTIRRRPASNGQLIDVHGITGTTYANLELPLYGAHQAQNAAIAIAAVEASYRRRGLDIDPGAIRSGLLNASSPGRFQQIGDDPVTIVDAAHNPHGVTAMLAALEETFPGAYVIGAAGILKEKDARRMFEQTAGVVRCLVLTRAPSDRATSPAELAHIARQSGTESIIVIDDPVHAVEEARRTARRVPQGLVIVFGSITLASLAIESGRHAN